jgi:putative endonuclease
MINMSKPANHVGKIAEDIAADYLTKQDLKLIDRNFHCRFGEIDLIGLEQELLVFVEVRYRKNEHYLAVVETIDQHKCRKLVITSEYYLSRHKMYRSYQCRYDVIAITGELNKPVIEWIKNAFQA